MLPKRGKKRFNVLTDETGRSKADYLRQLIENGLNELVEYLFLVKR